MAAVTYHSWGAAFCEKFRPVAFNPWKHHCRYICSRIEQLRAEGSGSIDQYLSYIGGTLLDFYMGELSVEVLAGEINSFFAGEGIYTAEAFKRWLGLPRTTFRSITLSDGSRWVMRLGQAEGFFIHAHPGRYSPLTVRCRPSTLRVAIAFRYMFGFECDDIDVGKVNSARKLANLPPLNSLNSAAALLKFITLLRVNKS